MTEEQYALVGRIAIGFNGLERFLRFTIEVFLGQGQIEAEVIKAVMPINISGKSQLLRKFTKNLGNIYPSVSNSSGRALAALDRLHKIAVKRNQIVHGEAFASCFLHGEDEVDVSTAHLEKIHAELTEIMGDLDKGFGELLRAVLSERYAARERAKKDLPLLRSS